MKFKMELDSNNIKEIIGNYISERFQNQININNLIFEVKNKQNYKVHEWEKGDFRILIEDDI